MVWRRTVPRGEPPGRLVERHTPRGQRLADRHGEDALGAVERARGVDRAAVAVEDGEHALALEPAQRLLEHVAAQRLVAAAERREQRLVAGPLEHRGEHDRSPTMRWRRPPRSQNPCGISARSPAKTGASSGRQPAGWSRRPWRSNRWTRSKSGVRAIQASSGLGAEARPVDELTSEARHSSSLWRIGHLDLLGGHGGHVARLLAEEELGGGLPLAQRHVAEHGQDGRGEDDRGEGEMPNRFTAPRGAGGSCAPSRRRPPPRRACTAPRPSCPRAPPSARPRSPIALPDREVVVLHDRVRDAEPAGGLDHLVVGLLPGELGGVHADDGEPLPRVARVPVPQLRDHVLAVVSAVGPELDEHHAPAERARATAASLLIHGPPVISGAGCPTRGPRWASPAAGASASAASAAAASHRFQGVMGPSIRPAAGRRVTGLSTSWP